MGSLQNAEVPPLPKAAVIFIGGWGLLVHSPAAADTRVWSQTPIPETQSHDRHPSASNLRQIYGLWILLPTIIINELFRTILNPS